MSKFRIGNFRIPEDPPSGPSFVAIIILFCIPEIVTKVVGGVMLYKRLRNESLRKRYKLFRRYASAIGNRETVSIRGLAAEVGLSTGEVASGLQAMIDEGMIGGNAYIDRSHMTLHMEPARETAAEDKATVVNVFLNTRDQANAAGNAAQPRQAQPAKEEAPAQKRKAPEPRKTGMESEDFEAKLREIRQLNDEIEDHAVSDRIDRIGELTASIFRVVQEKPEHAEEVRKFMNYYLPTTLKLLKSYSLMEKQSYQGENIQASRKKIEDVLDTLTHAFEKQQDRLFKTEALDVETDITVLETMMVRDGLTEQQGLKLGGH